MRLCHLCKQELSNGHRVLFCVNAWCDFLCSKPMGTLETMRSVSAETSCFAYCYQIQTVACRLETRTNIGPRLPPLLKIASVAFHRDII
jgi:hypothetical protein